MLKTQSEFCDYILTLLNFNILTTLVLFLKIYLYHFKCMNVFPPCMSVYRMCVLGTQKSKESVRFTGTGGINVDAGK